MTAGSPLDYGELYRVLAESTPDAIITIDENSTILSINPAGERLVGYREAELVGGPLARIMPERFRASHHHALARYLATGERHIPWQAIRMPLLARDGHEIPVEISFGTFKSGDRSVFSAILRDISERVATDAVLAANAAALQNQALELEQQVEEAQVLGEEIELANHELSAANRKLEQARDEAEAAAARLREVFESLSDSVSVFDRDWRFTYLNPAARAYLETLGLDPAAVLGREVWSVLPALLGTPFETESRRAVATNQPVAYVEYFPPLERWFENRVIPSATTITTFGRDVTEQHRAAELLRAREAEYRAIVNSIPTLAWMARADGWITWYNDRWYEYTGTTPEQMEGWGWKSVHDPETLPSVLERWTRSIETGEPFEMTFPLLGADGRFRPFLTRVVPIRDAQGTLVRWLGTNTDVETESALRREAEEANRAKSEFLGVMSHELRTPLNAIGGYAELMELGVHGPLTDEQREDLHRIRQSQRHLLGLINQVLNYARVETGSVRYELSDVPANDALTAAEALVIPQLRTRGLTLVRDDCSPSLRARADQDKLQQILLNLLTNAIKFTEPGGEIRIGCSACDGYVTITVTDSGIGIAADKLASIFEPFVQVDQRLTRASEGVGLGLSISRDLARGMGGDLTAESTPGTGSTFTLTLPLAK